MVKQGIGALPSFRFSHLATASLWAVASVASAAPESSPGKAEVSQPAAPAQAPSGSESPAAAGSSLDREEGGVVYRGQAIPSSEREKAVTVAELLKAPRSFEGRSLVLDGHVKQVCAKKGCWFTLSPNDSTGSTDPHVRVTSKGYLFFVPKDAAGYAALALGTVRVKTLSKEEVQHLEEDARAAGGKPSPLAVEKDGTALEVQFEAQGVELRPQS